MLQSTASKGITKHGIIKGEGLQKNAAGFHVIRNDNLKTGALSMWRDSRRQFHIGVIAGPGFVCMFVPRTRPLPRATILIYFYEAREIFSHNIRPCFFFVFCPFVYP